MRINENTIAQARAADVLSFFEKYSGFTFTNRGGEYRCQQHPSLAVKQDRLSWYWHSKGVGGHGVLDYLTKVENMPFRQAVEVVTGTTPEPPPATPARREAEPKKLILPEKTGIPLRLYDYLCVKRGIDGEIVHLLIQRKMLYEDRRGNVVFVGFDEHGKARFASVRGTYGDCSFRGDCAGSDKRYGFYMESAFSNKLYIFESPIDAMSRASLENAFRNDKEAWKRYSYISLAGTSDTALPFFLNKRPDVKELVLCLDNDAPGREAAAAMSRKYADKGYYMRVEPPLGKDCNEDLQAYRAQIQAEKRAQKRHHDVII
jgi:hypothetical protein